ncbi:hypothetical protein BP423_22480 [Salmonella enterica]|nr:hypothetical protein [Salmonella enterica]
MISIAFASFILLALVVLLTLKQASYNGKVSSPAVSRLPANQFRRYFVGKKPGGRLVLIDELGGTWTEKVTVIHTNAG